MLMMKMKALTAAEAGVLQLLTMTSESSCGSLGNFCLLRWVPRILMFITGSPECQLWFALDTFYTKSIYAVNC